MITGGLFQFSECPTNSIFFGEYCYTISSGTATFENARSSCESEGGNLMWFEDEEEYTMVTLMFSDAHPGIVRYWTGRLKILSFFIFLYFGNDYEIYMYIQWSY